MPVIKGVKKAIIVYEDPKSKDGHRIVFGDLPSLMEFMIDQMPIIWKKIQDMAGQNFSSPFEMIEYYKKHKKDYEKIHAVKGAEEAEMTLSFKFKKLK